MSTIMTTPDYTQAVARIIVENTDVGADALRIEAHKRKTDRVNAEKLFNERGGDISADKGVKVTSYTLPPVKSHQQPNIEQAEKYLDSKEFGKAVTAPDATFTMKMFGRGFEFFSIIRDMAKVMRSDANNASAAITKMRDKINTSLQKSIIQKGQEAMAMSISASVTGMAVSGAGTGKLLKTSTTARTDLKNTQFSLPKQEGALRNKEAQLAKLDPKKQEDRAAITTLKQEIRNDKTAIDDMKFNSNLKQNRADSSMTAGMAVQAMGQGFSGMINGVGESVNAVNQANVTATESSAQMLQELGQKVQALVDEQRELMRETLQTMSTLTQMEQQMWAHVASNIK